MSEVDPNVETEAAEQTLVSNLAQSEVGGSEREIAEAAARLADFYGDRGNYYRAESLYHRAIEIKEHLKGSESLSIVVDLRKLAALYAKRGDIEQAESLYRRNLFICKTSSEIPPGETIVAMSGLAILLRLEGRIQEAVVLQKQALALSGSIEWRVGSHSLVRLKGLAVKLLTSVCSEESEPLLNRTLHLSEGNTNSSPPVVAEIFDILAILYKYTAENSFSDELLERIRNISERMSIKLARPNVIDASRHPLAGGIAPDWASGWGEDEHGVFVEITVDEVTQVLRWCPPGRFTMGSPADEAERYDDEGPQTEITLEQGFWLFDAPVTQELYGAVTGETPSHLEGPDRPVEQVSWDDATTFLDRINERIPGLDLCLPSEAQWEYACRAGSSSPFEPNVARTHAGASITPEEVNFDGNLPYGAATKSEYREEILPVKPRGFRPNAWGLWQMHGNVWDWCEDAWHDSHEGAAVDGSPRPASQPGGEADRVIRGGSWGGGARDCRAAFRVRLAPAVRVVSLGFRPARGQASGTLAGAAEPHDASRRSGRIAFDPEGAR